MRIGGTGGTAVVRVWRNTTYENVIMTKGSYLAYKLLD